LFGVLPSRRYEVARRVRRIYLPHGSFRTDERQRLVHIATGLIVTDANVEQWAVRIERYADG
jgi:hypothetical protein